VLAQLVDKSMVLVEAHERVARHRFRSPPAVRYRAAEGSGEAEAYRARHAAASPACADEQRGWRWHRGDRTLDRLEAEHANLQRCRGRSDTKTPNGLASCRGIVPLRAARPFSGGLRVAERASPLPRMCRRNIVAALNALAFLYRRGGNAGARSDRAWRKRSASIGGMVEPSTSCGR
jgi:hypothetical protein